MAPEQEAAVGRELVARLDDKIKHVNEMIEQKLEYQGKLIDSRLDGIEKTNAEKILGFSIRLEEAVQEIRGYKEILQQQVTLLDSSIKKAHSRMDDMDSHGSTFDNGELVAVRKELQDGLQELEIMMGNIKKLEEAKHDEELLQEAKENNPWRKFFEENGKRVLLFALTGLGLYLLKNLPEVLKFISAAAKVGGGE